MAKECKKKKKKRQNFLFFFFQDKHFDIIVCFEDRVFEAVLDDYLNRDSVYNKSCHVINLNTKDNHEEAEKAGDLCLKFCYSVADNNDWENEITLLIETFEKMTKRKMNHVIFFD